MTWPTHPLPNGSGAGASRQRSFGLPPIQTYVQYPPGTERGNPPTDADNLYDPYMSYAYAAPLTTYSTPSPPVNRQRLESTYTGTLPQFVMQSSLQYEDVHFLIAHDSVVGNNFSYDVRGKPRDNIHEAIYSCYRDLWIARSRPTFIRIVSDDLPWSIDIKVAIPSEPSSAEGQTQPHAAVTQGPSGSRSGSDTSQSPRQARTSPHTPSHHGSAPVHGGTLPPEDVGVSCGDVWKALHYNLRQPIMDSEFAILNSAALESHSANARLQALLGAADRRFRRSGGDPEARTLRRVDWLGRKTLFVGLKRDATRAVSSMSLLPDREPCEDTFVAVFKERL